LTKLLLCVLSRDCISNASSD